MASYWDTGALRKNSGQAWHGEALLFEDGDYAIPTFWGEHVGIDYTYEVCPYVVIAPDGTQIPSNKFAIMRSPCSFDSNWKEIRSNVKNTTPIQPQTIMEVLDPLARKYPMEGIMSLKEGSIFGVTMEMPGFMVRDIEAEGHKVYFGIFQDLSLPGALIVMQTLVRIVCWNTWQLALSKTEGVTRLPHSVSDPETILQIMVENEKALITRREQEIQWLNSLFVSDELDKSGVDKFLEKVFPAPKRGFAAKLRDQTQELETQLAEKQQTALNEMAASADSVFKSRDKAIVGRRVASKMKMDQFLREDENDASLAYALFQGVTDVVNHGAVGLVRVRGDNLNRYVSTNTGSRATELVHVRKTFDVLA